MIDMSKKKQIGKICTLFAIINMVAGCNFLSRLAEVGEEPELSTIENPVEKKDYKPVSMPMPKPIVATPNSNSLWRSGSRGFFKDQRASQIGDIITVKVKIKDEASLDNKSEQKRGNNSDSVKINSLAGLETKFDQILPDSVNPANLIDLSSSRTMVGDGTIDREEDIEVTMAAVITQVLPNGNLVIKGTQEVRVNYELRELVISGIIRRSDIKSDNTIESSKIAELRVAYGGRGTISDVQQPRYGSQVLDVFMPF